MSVGRIGGAGIDELYMAMMELEQEQRKAAKAVRHAAQEAQVDAMMDQADQIERQARWQAIGQASAGLHQIGSAVASGFGESTISGSTKGGGELLGAYFTYEAGQAGAAQKRCEARAAAQGAVAADAGDVEERAREVTQALQRRLDQAQEAQNSAMAAILRA